MKKLTKLKATVLALLMALMVFASFAAVSFAAPGDTSQDEHDETKWYTIDYTEGRLTVTLNPSVKSYFDLTRSDISVLKDHITSVLTKIVVGDKEELKASVKEEVKETIIRENTDKYPAGTTTSDVPDSEITNTDWIRGILSKYNIRSVNDVDVNTLMPLLAETGFTYEELLAINWDKVYASDLIEGTEEEKEALVTKVTDAVKKAESDSAGAEGAVDKTVYTLRNLITAVNALSVDGLDVYSQGYFNISSLKTLISNLPKPSEIAVMSDSEMNLTWQISLDTLFGVRNLSFTIGFDGDCTRIREGMKLIADHLSVSRGSDGAYVIGVNMPMKLSELLLRACDTTKLSDNLKNKLFAALTKDGDEMYAFYETLTFDDVLELLRKVDFEGALQSGNKYIEECKKLFAGRIDFDNLTNEQIVAKVAEYERYYNKLCRMFETYFEMLPEKYRTVTVMDFYKGSGVFSAKGSFTVNVEKLLEPISASKAALIASFFRETEINLAVDVTVEAPRVNKVEYVYNGRTIRQGVLPAGADIGLFAPGIEGLTVLGWVDADGNSVTEMPDADVALTPVLLGIELTDSGDVNVKYDGTSHRIFVRASVAVQDPHFAYKWYKDGILIDGATKSYLDLTTVADSGVYTCEVSLTSVSGVSAVTSREIIVGIGKGSIDMSAVKWSYTNPFTYDGTEHTVTLENLPELVTATITGDKGTNAGTYTAKAVFTYDADNYELTNTVDDLSWTINKAQIDMSDVKWSYTNPFTYNGTEHTVTLENLPELVTATFTGDKGTNAGTYTAKAVFTYDADNYELANNNIVDLSWTINKAQIDMSGVKWSYTNPFTYNGTEHTVTLENLPELVTATITGDKGTNAGTYTAKAVFAYDADNYELANNNVADLSWTINKAQIDMSDVKWSYTNPFTYDGSVHTVELINLPDGVTATYRDNTATDAGPYSATAILAYDSQNYTLSDNIQTTLTWTIAKAKIDLSGVTWSYTNPFDYDGKAHTVTLENIPDGYGLVAEYTGNSATASGEYTASVTFTGYDSKNYELENLPADLSWRIEGKPAYDMSGVKFEDLVIAYDGLPHYLKITGALPDGVTVEITGEAGMLPGSYVFTAKFTGDDEHAPIPDMTATLTILPFGTKKEFRNELVTVISDSDINENFVLDTVDKTSDYSNADLSGIKFPDGYTGRVAAAYDIYFSFGGAMQTLPSGNYGVRLLIPANLRDKNLKVIHISDDGNVTDMDATRDGNYMVFETPHFSIYAIVEVTEVVPETAGFPWWIIPLIIVAVLLIIAIILLVIKHNNKPEPEEPKEEQAENEPEPEPETAPEAEEITEPEVEPETEAEPEPVVEPETEAEPEVEEAPAPAEEPEVEEAPAPAEEPEQLAVIAPASDEEEPETEEAEPPVTEEEEQDVVVTYIDGKAMRIRYNYSFRAKLIQSSAETQSWFGEICDLIDSYKNVKRRESWKHVRVNTGRDALSYLFFRGKRLCMTFALDPNEFAETKYRGEDLSDIKKYAATPMMLRLTSQRKAKYAKELLVLMLERKGAVTNAEPTVSEVFSLPYETREELIARDLVRVSGTEPFNPADTFGEPQTAGEPAVQIDEPIVEETPAQVDEPVAEATEPKGKSKIIVGEDAPGAFVDADHRLINGELVPVRYRSSFMSRLIQGDSSLQDYYTVIKNTLLSYKGIKARMSWNIESFNKSRDPIARINAKGKALMLYLALDPKDYNVNKYHFTDVSGKPKFDVTPMMIKVRSNRSLKYALELIEELMRKLELPLGKPANVDYHMPYETNEQLVAKKLVKLILPAGVKLDGDESIIKVDVGDFIGSHETDDNEKKTEEPAQAEEPVVEEPAQAEEPVVEEPAQAEEPVVEEPAQVEEPVVEEPAQAEEPVAEEPAQAEEPVAEEPAQVEEPVAEEPTQVEEPVAEEPAQVEEPVVEEPAQVEEPVVEEPAHVFISSEEADIRLSDEEAEQSLEKIAPIEIRSGKLVEINIGTICDNYDDGELVTLESLKEKRLIPKNAGRIKVLAGGVMTKALTIEADKYSIQAVKMITLAGGKAEQYR